MILVLCRECWATAPTAGSLPKYCPAGAHRTIAVDSSSLRYDPETRTYEVENAPERWPIRRVIVPDRA